MQTMGLYGNSSIFQRNRSSSIKTLPIQAILPAKVEHPESGHGIHLCLIPKTSRGAGWKCADLCFGKDRTASLPRLQIPGRYCSRPGTAELSSEPGRCYSALTNLFEAISERQLQQLPNAFELWCDSGSTPQPFWNSTGII